MQQVHQQTPETWSEGGFAFTDSRLEAMLLRLKGRNYPHLLSGDEMQAWEAFRSERLLDASASGARTFEHFAKELNELGQKLRMLVKLPFSKNCICTQNLFTQWVNSVSWFALFVYSGLAATLLPGGSEILFASLLMEQPEHAFWLWLIATLGNSLGGYVTFLWVGY